MSLKSSMQALLALAALATGSVPAFAEVSQRDQQSAAQRAYQESSRSYTDAQRGWERARETAERVRDAAIAIERRLIERAIRR